MHKPEVVSQKWATLGEGPIWDEERGVVYWLDIVAGRVLSYAPDSGQEAEVEVDQMIGAIALRAGGGLVAAMRHGFYFVDPKTGGTEFVVNPQEPGSGTRFNDGACDPGGRFWAGTMDLNEEPNAGSLYCLEPNREVTTVLHPVTISNGIVWTKDQKRMYYVDTATNRVDAFDYNVDTGTVSNRRPAVEIPKGTGFPDGMAIDVEDKIWVAHWEGSRVTRWDPATGNLLATVELPVDRPTSMTFGDPDRKTLYVSTARIGLSETELQAQPDAGHLFAFRTDVPGPLGNRFSG